MKIAFVCHRFYPHIGGVETVVFQLASVLAAKGIDVTVLTQTNDTTLAKKERINNFYIRRFPEMGFGEMKISIGLFRYLQKHAHLYDVVHTQNYHAFPSLCVALTKKKPVIFSPHYHGTGHSLFTRLLHYPYRLIGSFIFSQSDAVLCDSQAEMNLVKKHFSHTKNTVLIPLGIDVAGIQKAAKCDAVSAYILSVGRLEQYKNVEVIIRALQFIRKEISLVIVGDGPIKQQLLEVAQKLHLADRISFRKNVSTEDLHRLLKSAKAYITMSRMEAYGLSLLEAVAAGLGIVASDIPAHRDLIKKFDIQYVPLVHPNISPESLARYIMEVIATPSHTGKALPSWELVTEQTLDVYNQVSPVKGVI